MARGLFVTFEGIDGCGKTLMQNKVAAQLRAAGWDVVMTREPGGCELGREIRRLLLASPVGSVDERAEVLLYAADRAQHVQTVIRPALQKGQIVISDRYLDSSFAYQGSGRRLGLTDLRKINDFAIDGLWPDITFLLDLPVEIALSRLRGKKDRLEQEDAAFFARTAEAYRALATAEPERFVVIDATQKPGLEAAAIWAALKKRLPARES